MAATDPIGSPIEVVRTAESLLPLFYDEVRRIASRQRRTVQAGQTLQTTALIHEAYLKLCVAGDFSDHAHFLRAAALAMRHVLISYARYRTAGKRGGGVAMLPLNEEGALEGVETAPEVDVSADNELLDVNEALGRLAALSPRLAQIVECRFFAGYSDRETAEALGLADRTVRRDWVKARAWLRRELARDDSEFSD
ncbi:MAG: sigma-70 family RNA polymerase sigma factor [Sinobacteraceae bacterium]|nr:sigma-70 family RNA polymerase sigma factor [Nevskiaceae bacterium]